MINNQIKIGNYLLVAIIVFSIISFYFENYNQVNLDQALISPFFNKNILGTDQFGRDVFLRASRATYISIMVGFSSNIIASILGVFIGAIAGFYKKFDMLIMGCADEGRVLVNDINFAGKVKAHAANLKRNAGMEDYDWSEVGL